MYYNRHNKFRARPFPNMSATTSQCLVHGEEKPSMFQAGKVPAPGKYAVAGFFVLLPCIILDINSAQEYH